MGTPCRACHSAPHAMAAVAPPADLKRLAFVEAAASNSLEFVTGTKAFSKACGYYSSAKETNALKGSLTKIEHLIKAYGTPVVSKVQEKYPGYMNTVDAKVQMIKTPRLRSMRGKSREKQANKPPGDFYCAQILTTVAPSLPSNQSGRHRRDPAHRHLGRQDRPLRACRVRQVRFGADPREARGTESGARRVLQEDRSDAFAFESKSRGIARTGHHHRAVRDRRSAHANRQRAFVRESENRVRNRAEVPRRGGGA